MDNKLFNINGRNFYEFKLALQLLLSEEESDLDFDITKIWGKIGTGVEGYRFLNEKGLLLYWHLGEYQITQGVKPIENLIVDNNDPILKKSLRKYKLALLNEKLKDRVGIPFELLAHSLWNWLVNFSDYDKLVYDDWEDNLDHDGHNEKGFRIYTEDWGHININGDHTIDHYTIGAIKPVYLWYGK